MVCKADLQILIGKLSFLGFVFECSEETNASLHSPQRRLGFRKRFAKSTNWKIVPLKQKEQPAAIKTRRAVSTPGPRAAGSY